MLLKALQSTIMLIINIENRNSLYENGKKNYLHRLPRRKYDFVNPKSLP